MTLRPHEFGNFRPTKTKRLKAKAAAPKLKREAREGNSEKHLSAIRTLPCCIPGCCVVGCDPHHLKTGLAKLERGMGQRATDRWTLPMCRGHHDEIEAIGSRREEKWFLDRAIEAIDLAAALWTVSPEKGAMARIVLAHKTVKP